MGFLAASFLPLQLQTADSSLHWLDLWHCSRCHYFNFILIWEFVIWDYIYGVSAVLFVKAFLAVLFCPLWSGLELHLRIVVGYLVHVVQAFVLHLVMLWMYVLFMKFSLQHFSCVPRLGFIKWLWTAFAILNLRRDIILDALYSLLCSIHRWTLRTSRPAWHISSRELFWVVWKW